MRDSTAERRAGTKPLGLLTPWNVISTRSESTGCSFVISKVWCSTVRGCWWCCGIVVCTCSSASRTKKDIFLSSLTSSKDAAKPSASSWKSAMMCIIWAPARFRPGATARDSSRQSTRNSFAFSPVVDAAGCTPPYMWCRTFSATRSLACSADAGCRTVHTSSGDRPVRRWLRRSNSMNSRAKAFSWSSTWYSSMSSCTYSEKSSCGGSPRRMRSTSAGSMGWRIMRSSSI
mmetsp:Transcript_39923/g.124863  ORF Transcript_39923/g.124863 Transcript_39923/m.124863 type:complete len:231 (+) Transcript_39923:3575-4267(+)